MTKGATLKAVYAHDENGNESMVSYTENARAWTLVQRATGGVVKVGTPVSERDAVTKEYVDNGFVPKTTQENGIIAYAAVGNKTVMIPVRDNSEAWSIPRRDGLGNINVGTPRDPYHTTNKAYVDNLNAITITAGA